MPKNGGISLNDIGPLRDDTFTTEKTRWGKKKNAKRSEVLPAVTDGINCNFKRKLNKEQFLNGNFLFSDRIPSNEISDSPLQNAPY